MPHVSTICCALIGTGAVALGSAIALHPVPLPPKASASLDERGLQRLADNSCRCERSAGAKGKKSCWAAFDAQMPEKDSTQEFTTCLPIPRTIRCRMTDPTKGHDDSLMDPPSGPCVTTDYIYEGGNGEVRLCSSQEAAAVERVWNREVVAGSRRTGTPIADRLAHDLAAGNTVPDTSGPGLCTSS